MKTCRQAKSRLRTLVVGIGLLVAATPAWAGHRRPHSGRYRTPVWIPAVYETRARTIKVLAVWEERPRDVWRDPVYDTRRVQVTIPPEVETERVPRYSKSGRLIGFDLVQRVVTPGRKAWKTERVLIRAGYWETVVDRVCVKPASTKIVYEKVLVRPGYWSKRACQTIRKSRPHHRVTRRRGTLAFNGPDLRFAVRIER